ncbi:TPA: tail fiber assembly protein [Citrobacter freundii]|nr:tail fiber assembly protein [Citrobacter freundii]
MREKYFYSPATNGFYAESQKKVYESGSAGWPSDAIEITTPSYAELMGGAEKGLMISPDVNGSPVLVKNGEMPKQIAIFIADKEKKLNLNDATQQISIIEDSAKLNIATDAELILLEKIKKYRILLNRIDISQAPDIEWPEKPQ